jgi:RIO-like serine/threonine protein kinase
MELIKENIEKNRRVYFCGDRYRKVWKDKTEWIYTHVKTLEYLFPGYVLSHGNDYIEYAIIEGTLASDIKHTDQFIRQVYIFCLENIKATKPWIHGDWVLSNIIIQPNGQMVMIDWDNLNISHETDYTKKLHSDLISAFGKENFKRAIGDSASI